MVHLLKKRSAFTLIELLVVVIIVAVLAGVGVPLLSANVVRAKLSEADAGLGTIRTGIRAYIAENNTLPASLALSDVGLRTGDLKGRYFDNTDYIIKPTVSTTNFCIEVKGNRGGTSTAVKANDADTKDVTRTMDQDGTIVAGGTCA